MSEITDMAIVAKYSYSNPFWSMGEPQLGNPLLIEMARSVRELVAPRNKKAKLFVVGSSVGILPPVVSFIIDMNRTIVDEYGNVYESGFTPLTYVLIFAWVVFVGVTLFRLIFSILQIAAIQNKIKQSSIAEYRSWLQMVRRTDPHLFAEVVRWEQEQERLQIQKQILSTAQDQLRETRLMRNELNQVKQYVDPLRPRSNWEKH